MKPNYRIILIFLIGLSLTLAVFILAKNETFERNKVSDPIKIKPIKVPDPIKIKPIGVKSFELSPKEKQKLERLRILAQSEDEDVKLKAIGELLTYLKPSMKPDDVIKILGPSLGRSEYYDDKDGYDIGIILFYHCTRPGKKYEDELALMHVKFLRSRKDLYFSKVTGPHSDPFADDPNFGYK